MTLGMISWIREEDFQRVKAKGLSFVELDVNDRVKEFLDALEQTKEYSKKYDLPVAAIGRWGSARIDENGIREEELAIEYSLIDAAAELGTGIYAEGGGGRPTPWVYQDAKGNWHYTRGNKAKPFLKPAAADHVGQYRDILESELKNG